MSATNEAGPLHEPRPTPSRSGKKRLRYARVSGKYALLVIGCFPMMLLVWMVAGLTGVAIALVVAATIAFWTDGITIDTEKRTATVWAGPLFPVFWTNHPLDDYDAVSVVTDSFEVYNQRSSALGALGPEQRNFSTVTGLKLVARLTPQTRYPEDLPEPLVVPLPLLRKFRGSKTTLQEEGRLLAETLGFHFMDVR